MLLTKKVKVRWNPKTKTHYVNKGYKFTKMNDYFDVDVSDLTTGSNVYVDVKCDYCDSVSSVSWHSYVRLKEKELVHKDCCNSAICTTIKSQETLQVKYGTTNIREIDGVNEKIASTNVIKYGCDNPFGNTEIQQKIRSTNIQKYGCPVPTQNEAVTFKYKRTCLDKYGVDNYSKTEKFRKEFSGRNSPNWKENTLHERTERQLPEYREWRQNVFQRDHFTCQCCGAHNHKGNNQTVVLNAHHIYNFNDNKDKAIDLDNGITLCEKCHIKFHSIYGKKNNTPEQLSDFLLSFADEKIC